MGPPRSKELPPGEEIYQLEQKWFRSCRDTHDLFCLCGDWRQHILPGCGVFHLPGDGAGGDGDDGLDDVMVDFDLGDLDTITGGADTEDAPR